MGADADFVGRMGPQLELLLPLLDEKSRRLVLGAVARAAGDGGVTAVAAATGAGWQTVADGAADLVSGEVPPPGRSRRPGGGRKRLEDHDPRLTAAMSGLLEESSRGDPMSLLLWTTLSVRDIAAELTRQGHPCGRGAVLRMLRAGGFSTQGNSRTIQGRRHPDRDAQFRYIDLTAKQYLAAGDPVISVDTKKKEQVGRYANAGRCWRPAGDPVRVRDHDFPDPGEGKVAPYGIYDVGDNSGFVNVGTDHDTAAFAVESIRRWWDGPGKNRYPGARRLLVTCDAGGSNGYRTRAWKAELAALAAQAGLEITVLHFPPGTSKWNKIEHRLFSQITRTWRGRPLTSHQVILSTIAATTTSTGLKVTAVLDTGRYPTGTEVSDEQAKDLEDRFITRHGFHGTWNYTISPVPRAPAPQPAPAPAPPPGPDLDALTNPAITGIPREDLAATAAALRIPWAAAREQRLHLARGGPRRQSSGPAGPFKLSLDAYLLAAVCRYRLGMTCRAIAALLAIDPSIISVTTRQIAGLLARAGTPLTPGPHRLRTLSDLRRHAAAAGITIPPADNPPADTLTTPETPQTHLN